ncbi:MAG TPA: low temperature requirement protein A [Rubrobacteraceae bacterium]|nr:low temperature requirement protein A [Rubrobacteraceae bacterium]
MSDAPKPDATTGTSTKAPEEASERRRPRFVRPPVLRNLTPEQRSSERTSTPLELFFDLCFVVAVAALARGLHDEPNLGGALRFLGLFVPVWWSWMIFSWYATAFDNDDVPYRVTLLAAMLSMLGLAASVGEVGVEPDAAVSFVLAYASMRLLMTGLFLRAWRPAPASLRPFVILYAAGNALGAAVWLSSLLVPEPGRYAVWAVGLFVELLGPILAVRTLSNPRVSFHPRHIAERYGLFTIIVLGESVLAVVVGTADTDWEPSAVLTAVFGFVVAACVWWLYFDHVGSSGIELGPRPAFYWGYGHFAVYAGIAAFGVGAQLAIEAAAETEVALASAAPAGSDYDLGARLVLAGGIALYLAGIAFVDRVNEGAAGDRAVLVRLATAAFLIVLALLGALLSPPAFVAVVTLALLALTVLESLREDPIGGM